MILDEKILGFLPKTFFPNSILEAKAGERLLKSLNSKKVLFVVSTTAFKLHEEKIKSLLQNCAITIFELGREPTIEDKDKIISVVKAEKFDLIIGLGGGSVLDLAKIVKMESELDLILIPATVGSGSEASQFSLLTNKSEKVILASYKLLPNLIILDPEYCKTAKREVLAYSIIDALSHALEGLVSKNSNELTDILATKVIDIILDNALKALDHDINSLALLQKAGFLAGIVQSTASVGLMHGIAHSIGPQNNISHGKALSLYFIDVLKFNNEKTDSYKKLNSCKNLSSINFIEKLEQLLINLGINSKEISHVDAEIIRKDPCTKTNPYSPSKEDIEGILNRQI